MVVPIQLVGLFETGWAYVDITGSFKRGSLI